MYKTSLILILLASLILGACAYQSPTTTVENFTTEAPAEAASPAPQKPTQTATPSQVAEATTVPELAVNGCTVQSPFPTPGPTEQALLPPPSKDDWVNGLDTASVTLTEYSDFQ